VGSFAFVKHFVDLLGDREIESVPYSDALQRFGRPYAFRHLPQILQDGHEPPPLGQAEADPVVARQGAARRQKKKREERAKGFGTIRHLSYYFLVSKSDKTVGIDQILVGGFEPVVAARHLRHPHSLDLAAELRHAFACGTCGIMEIF